MDITKLCIPTTRKYDSHGNHGDWVIHSIEHDGRAKFDPAGIELIQTG